MRRVGLGVAVGGGRVSVGVSEGSGVSLGIRDVSLGATGAMVVWVALVAAVGAGALQAASVNDMTSNRLRTKCNLRDMSFLLDEK
jgi:hypothetical protein